MQKNQGGWNEEEFLVNAPPLPQTPFSLLLVVRVGINQPQLLDTTKDKPTGISKPKTQRCQLICSMLLDQQPPDI